MDDEHTALLVETIARHFPGARIEGSTVWTGVGGLAIECEVNDLQSWGPQQRASLFFRLRGGRLGDVPVFASMSGYEATAPAAIVVGACNWACSFGPVLRAGLADEEGPDLERIDCEIAGRPFRVVLDGIDRAMLLGDDDDGGARASGARRRLGGEPWLSRRVLDSGTLPILSASVAVLSVFVWDAPGSRVVEVKVNGRDWSPSSTVFAHAEPAPEGAICLLRELAVLTPRDSRVVITRPHLESTIDGLAAHEGSVATGWAGWRQHAGRLGAVLSAAEIARLEADTGALPSDYRAFLADVASCGAGPGYGLLRPTGEAQRSLAHGRFSWTDAQEDAPDPSGVIALGHAGCGLMWLLVVEGAHRGEVWIDARGSDGKVRRVAASFTDWYASWLDSAVRDALWHQWDASGCATPHALSRAIEAMDPPGGERPLEGRVRAGALSLASIGATYFDHGAPLDPCHPCVLLAEDLGVQQDAFGPGTAPRAGAGAANSAGRGLSRKLRRFFTRSREDPE